MSDDDLEVILTTFDALDGAAQRILVSQPWQMTEAAAKLDVARLKMREVIHKKLLKRAALR